MPLTLQWTINYLVHMLSACWLIGAYFLAVSSHKRVGAWYLSVYGRTVSMKVSFHLLRECPLFGESLVPLYTIPYHTKAVGGGGGGGEGVSGSPPPPPPPDKQRSTKSSTKFHSLLDQRCCILYRYQSRYIQ